MLLFYVCECLVHVYLCTTYVSGAFRVQNPLELLFQRVVSHHVLGIEPESSERVASVLGPEPSLHSHFLLL